MVFLQSVSQFAPLRVSLPILARRALSLGDLGSDSDFHRMCRLRRVGHLALQPPGIQPLEAVTQSVYSDIESVKRRECSKAPAKLEGPQGWTPSRDGGGGHLAGFALVSLQVFSLSRVMCTRVLVKDFILEKMHELLHHRTRTQRRFLQEGLWAAPTMASSPAQHFQAPAASRAARVLSLRVHMPQKHRVISSCSVS